MQERGCRRRRLPPAGCRDNKDLPPRQPRACTCTQARAHASAPPKTQQPRRIHARVRYGRVRSSMNPNQLDPPASLGKSERSDRSKKVSLQPARLREFDNRILCCTKRFYAYWLTKSVTAAVDGRGRRLKSATRGLRSVWAAKNSRGLASPQIHNAFWGNNAS